MQLDILSPEKRIYSGEADAVTFPGSEGMFQVLNHHAPMIASLKSGTIKVRLQKQETFYKIREGFVEVLKNKVTVLVEGAE
jgi:F-type H+-transporting ATPase subunit epsilon